MSDTKSGFIDGDGVIWDNKRRWVIAEEIALATTGLPQKPSKPAKAYHKQFELDIATAELGLTEMTPESEEDYSYENVQNYYNVFWRTYFMPELVWLDTLIPGAADKIKEIVARGYTVWILTSNMEQTQQERIKWLERHNLNYLASTVQEGGSLTTNLITKPADKQFTTTAVWKAEEIQSHIQPGVTDILVVDDAPKNIEAIRQLDLKGVQTHLFNDLFTIIWAEAITVGIKGTFVEDVEIFPDFIVRKGFHGEVVEVDSDFVVIKVKEYMRGAEEWETHVNINYAIAGDMSVTEYVRSVFKIEE